MKIIELKCKSHTEPVTCYYIIYASDWLNDWLNSIARLLFNWILLLSLCLSLSIGRSVVSLFCHLFRSMYRSFCVICCCHEWIPVQFVASYQFLTAPYSVFTHNAYRLLSFFSIFESNQKYFRLKHATKNSVFFLLVPLTLRHNSQIEFISFFLSCI